MCQHITDKGQIVFVSMYAHIDRTDTILSFWWGLWGVKGYIGPGLSDTRTPILKLLYWNDKSCDLHVRWNIRGWMERMSIIDTSWDMIWYHGYRLQTTYKSWWSQGYTGGKRDWDKNQKIKVETDHGLYHKINYSYSGNWKVLELLHLDLAMPLRKHQV